MGQFGLVGLGVMGRNLALNAGDKGIRVIGYDIDQSASATFVTAEAGDAATGIRDLIGRLAPPRVVLLLLPAGAEVDRQIALLAEAMAPGDIIVDGGNSHFRDTERRAATLRGSGVAFVGLGISGGEEGARTGPAMMAGGDAAAVAEVLELFAPLAARAGGQPCLDSFGGGGAGHFVKMVHNGIEYADMQMIAEAYYLLRHGAGMNAAAIGQQFAEWNRGSLDSYLLDISARILLSTDEATGQPIVDVIRDAAGQKGTGHWAVTAAMELGVPAPSMAAAVNARNLSALWTERQAQPERPRAPVANAAMLIDAVHDALLGSRICAYAQGFALLAAGAREYGWPMDFGAVAKVWRGGCILRGQLLDPIGAAFADAPDLPNLMAHPSFRDRLVHAEDGWRHAVATAIGRGLPVPALASALDYWTGYGCRRLWADLVQAQRDYFGAHGFRRLDADGIHSGPWRTRA